MEEQVTITLTAQELMDLEGILMDRDQEEALRFLKECIKGKVEAARKLRLKPPLG